MHPFPLVKHPAKKVLHKKSELLVLGASEQIIFRHCVPVHKHGVVVVVSPDTRIALLSLQILIVKKFEQF